MSSKSAIRCHTTFIKLKSIDQFHARPTLYQVVKEMIEKMGYEARPTLYQVVKEMIEKMGYEVHIVTEEIVFTGMRLLQYLPVKLVDYITLMLSKFEFGDLSNYGLVRPKEGPFHLKALTCRSPTIDVGAMPKIKSGEIQVGNEIECVSFDLRPSDAINIAVRCKNMRRNL